MDNPDSEPVAAVNIDAGRVRVSMQVDASVDEVWMALLEPARLGKWFGELDVPWLVGRTGLIEFGDGDFFRVTPTEIIDEQLIALEWSFLGLGPLQQIRWSLVARSNGTEVVVEDRDPGRGQAEAEAMVEGWTDFLYRLANYLATGRDSRYDWRKEIDGAVDLPAGFRPLRTDAIYRWLPVASDGFQPRWFFIVDDEGPRRFQVNDWRLQPDRSLSFSIAIPHAAAGTECVVVADPMPGGTRLRMSHIGWSQLGLPGRGGLTLRSRFAKTWIASLDQARRLASSTDSSSLWEA